MSRIARDFLRENRPEIFQNLPLPSLRRQSYRSDPFLSRSQAQDVSSDVARTTLNFDTTRASPLFTNNTSSITVNASGNVYMEISLQVIDNSGLDSRFGIQLFILVNDVGLFSTQDIYLRDDNPNNTINQSNVDSFQTNFTTSVIAGDRIVFQTIQVAGTTGEGRVLDPLNTQLMLTF